MFLGWLSAIHFIDYIQKATYNWHTMNPRTLENTNRKQTQDELFIRCPNVIVNEYLSTILSISEPTRAQDSLHLKK